MTFRPLLAPRESPVSFPGFFEKLRFPLLCSPKLDGVRCIVKGGVALSRTGKPLRSLQVQEEYGLEQFEHWDGELVVGDPTAPDSCRVTTSHVMAFDKPGPVKFYAFDYAHPDWLHRPYVERLGELSRLSSKAATLAYYPQWQPLYHEIAESVEQLLEYEERCLKKGYEGVMMRGVDSPYKLGRATFNEGIIYKLKRFQDDEGVVVGVVEKLRNENELQTNELGYAKRSHAAEGKVPAGTVGMFQVEFRGEVIDVAPGNFTHGELQAIWDRWPADKGRLLTFRHFAHGVKDRPRFPRAVSFREDL